MYHENCSPHDLCIMVLILELMTIWRTQEQKLGVFQDYFVFLFPKIRIFEIRTLVDVHVFALSCHYYQNCANNNLCKLALLMVFIVNNQKSQNY